MSDYRRVYIQGGTCFFTLVTDQRKPFFNNPPIVKRLRDEFEYTRKKLPFSLKAIVILPDHLHCIWDMPGDDGDYSKRWSMIKGHVTKGAKRELNDEIIWQPRYWEHLIRNEDDLNRHLDYIHYNPVKHGYVSLPQEWKNSSIHKFIAKGWYPDNWGRDAPVSLDGMDFE